LRHCKALGEMKPKFFNLINGLFFNLSFEMQLLLLFVYLHRSMRFFTFDDS
jgi:hypothetical protein